MIYVVCVIARAQIVASYFFSCCMVRYDVDVVAAGKKLEIRLRNDCVAKGKLRDMDEVRQQQQCLPSFL